MMLRLFALAGLGLLAPVPADADTVLLDYTGTVISGEDTKGVTGQTGSLAGQSISLRFRVEDAGQICTPSGCFYGSQGYGKISLDYQIGSFSRSVAMSPDIRRIFEFYPENGGTSIGIEAVGPDPADGSIFEIIGYHQVDYRPSDYASIAPLTFTSFRTGGIGLQSAFPDTELGLFVYQTAVSELRITPILTPTDPTDPTDPTVPGGVPEPATWALLVLGFGAIGRAMRSRRAALQRA